MARRPIPLDIGCSLPRNLRARHLLSPLVPAAPCTPPSSSASPTTRQGSCRWFYRPWPPVSSLASPRCRSRRALRVPPPFRWLFPSLYGRRGTRREREMEHCCKPEGKRGPVHVARRLYSPDRNPTAASAAGARQVCDGARVAVRPASAAGGTGVRP